MSILQIIRIEWRRIWRNKIMRAAVFGIAVIPLLYSSLYLMAFWDPYGHMDKLPVAVVNEDTGATQSGKHVNFGSDIVKTLMTDKTMDWVTTSNAAATNGVRDGKYYMVLRIPVHFSQSIVSVTTNHPQKAELDFTPNQGENYLAGQIVGRVQNELVNTVSKQFSNQYISALLSATGKDADGLSTMSKNATLLVNGASKVKSGSTSLLGGVARTKSGADELLRALIKITPASGQITGGLHQTQTATVKILSGVSQGTNAIGSIRNQLTPFAGSASQLASGMNQLTTGSQQFVDSSQQLQNGLGQAQDSAQTLTSGLQSTVSSTNQLTSTLSEVNTLLSQSNASDPHVNQALHMMKEIMPSSQTLATSLGQLQNGANQLSTSMGKIASAQSELTTGLTQYQENLNQMNQATQSLSNHLGTLDSGLDQIQSGLVQASHGLSQLSTAQQQLFTGATQMHNGLLATTSGGNSLDSGLRTLQTGTQALTQGATTLASNEHTFASQVAMAAALAKTPNSSSTANMMANPIRSLTHALYPVSQYGPGFVPYFIPLSLWVGALMLSFLVSLREGRWRLAPVSEPAVIIGKLCTLWALATAQAMIASVFVLYGLGLHVDDVLGFFAFNIFTSITYVSIILLFIRLFGTSPGRFMGIILLVLQLTSSAGTFPIRLVPHAFQIIHPFVPMTYGVNELRNIIAIHNPAISWHSILITGLFWAASVLILTLWGSKKTSCKELKRYDELIA